MRNKKNTNTTKSLFMAIFVVVLAISFAFVVPPKAIVVSAPEETTPSPKPTPDTIEKLKQIEELKEKIATKVAELREKDKGAFFGTVKSIKEKTLEITTRAGDQKITFGEDVVVFSITDSKKSESALNKIKPGDVVSAFGFFEDRNIQTLNAKFIFRQDKKVHLIGKIADINKSNFTITVKEKQESSVVDIEKYTKTVIFKTPNKQEKGGFSKLRLNDTVHIFAIPTASKKERLSARSVYVFPFLTPPSPTPTPSKTKEATDSGKESTR